MERRDIQRRVRNATLLAAAIALLATGGALAQSDDAPAAPAPDGGDKLLSGMSIVGNDEAPKSLVIVPWKSSELGNTLEVSQALDNGRRPVDRDVFQRALNYYQIQSGWDASRSPTED